MAYRGGQWVVTGGPAADRLAARVPGFVPGWNPGEEGPGRAILAVAARLTGVLEDRLARAPDNAKLAFLDTLGVVPIPAQPAACPVVFELIPGGGHGHAPAGTRLGAPSAQGDPIVFETTDAIGLAASRLIEVKTALPGDRYTDHTDDVLGGRPFILFAGPQPVPRELYIGHDRLFALTPGAVVELQVELARGSGMLPQGAAIDWEYWDGAAWVGFVGWLPAGNPHVDQYSIDGTVLSAGRKVPLARSGTLVLRAGERPAAQLAVRGITSYWVRGRLRLAQPNPDDPQAAPPDVTADGNRPQIERLRARVRQSVGGFRVLSRTAKAIDPTDGRQIRLRLVDDSGGPLVVASIVPAAATAAVAAAGAAAAAAAPPLALWYWVFVSVPGRPGGTLLPPGADGLPPFKDPTASALDIRISAGQLDNTGLPTVNGQPIWDLPRIENLRPDQSYDFDLARAGRLPELAFANGLAVDPSSTFLPFGPQPTPGTAFYFTCPEVANKPGARVNVFTEVLIPDTPPDTLPMVAWEYWNGLVWAPLPQLEAGTNPGEAPAILSFCRSGDIRFTVPGNLAIKKEFGQEKPWMRARLVSGGYLAQAGGSVTVDTKTVTFPKVFPPAVQRFRLAYDYESPPEPPTACLSRDEFLWVDVTDRVQIGGQPFTPFGAPTDTRATLYLGFTRPLPLDLVSLYFDVASARAEPELVWEYSDGVSWQPLQLERDETGGLHTPGLVRFYWPGTVFPDPEPATAVEVEPGKTTIRFLDARSAARYRTGDAIAVFQDDNAELARVKQVAGAALVLQAPLETKFTTPLVAFAPPARFGTPRYWVRVAWPAGHYPRPTDPDRVTVQGIYLNATRAKQVRTQTDEKLGSTTGVGGEVFDFAQTPVLEGEAVWVLELDDGRAEAEWPLLQQEIQAAGKNPADWLRLDRDDRTGKVVGAWVRWEGVPSFAGSGRHDRHYTVERVRGRLQFGDGQSGMVPPPLPNNLMATYQAGGGRVGNLPIGAVNVLLGSVPGVQRVFNPVAASGGADGELAALGYAAATTDTLAEASRAILDRGPQLVRHRNRAVTAADYEQLARAASPGVAMARAITPAQTGCVVPAGSVEVVVVPYAEVSDPRPVPGPETIDRVQAYLQARAPAGVRVTVARPRYFPIGVEAILVPKDQADAGKLTRQAKDVIAAFLHPVAGGPEGRGWAFGRAVYRSDVVALLRRRLADLLAYPQDVRLLVEGVVQAEEAEVPADRLPAAGPIRVLLSPGGEVCP
jgi:predicted phage baseplate assembly protein